MSLVTSSQVETLLENVLFESPTLAAANAATWAAQVPASAATTSQAVDALGSAMLASPENQISSEVLALYMGVLNRVPQAGELQYYVNLIETGATSAQVAQGPSALSANLWNAVVADFVNSPEFQADLSKSDLITTLYHNVLGRTPGSAEVAYYQGLLAHGAPTADLVRDFVDSPEFRAGTQFRLAASAAEFVGIQLAEGVSGASSLTVPDEYASLWSQLLYSSSGVGVTTVTLANGTSSLTSITGSTATTGTITLGGTGNSLVVGVSSQPAGATSTGHYHVNSLTFGTQTQQVSINFDTLSDSFAGAAVTVSLAVSEPQALDLAAAATGSLAAGSAKLEWFQYGGNTYLVEVTNAGAASTHTALAATDYVVKLAGLVDLSAGSFNGGHNFTL